MSDFDDAPRVAADVLADLPGRFDGQIVTSVICLVEFIDQQSGEPRYAMIRDNQSSPLWRHIGLISYADTELRLMVS